MPTSKPATARRATTAKTASAVARSSSRKSTATATPRGKAAATRTSSAPVRKAGAAVRAQSTAPSARGASASASAARKGTASQTAPRKTPARRASAAPADAIALLTADHAEVKRMYRRYEKLVDADAGAQERGELANRICKALTVHAQIEEELFYPAVRAVLRDEDLMDEADVEHASAKELIAQIQGMDPDADKYDAKVIVLCEYVDHHVKEEEREMFPQCRRKRGLDLKQLGQQMAARKAELMGEGEGIIDTALTLASRAISKRGIPFTG